MNRPNTLILSVVMFSTCVLPCILSAQMPQRDPQAISILNQTLAAGGGAALLGTVQDFTGTGTIIYYWDPQVNGSMTVKGRGQRQFRIDATLPNGVRTLIANNGDGLLTEADGTVRSIPQQDALNLGNMTFPYPPLLTAIQNSSITIIYVGLVNHLGKQLHEVRIQNTYSKASDPDGWRTSQSARHFYIDPNTLLVAGISNVIKTDANSTGRSHEVVFANYQNINGVVAPLWMTESIGDQSLVTMQINQLVFNTGLRDSTFGR